MIPLAFLILFSVSTWAAVHPSHTPDLRLSEEGKVEALQRDGVPEGTLEILESEGCRFDKKKDGVQVGEPCDYLGGRYRYQDKTKKRPMGMDFSIQRGPKSHIFLVQKPIELVGTSR